MQLERGSLVPATDGLLARAIGIWSTEKLFYVRRYLEIFSRGMQHKHASRVYIDLFAGPGRCLLDDGSREFDGSPLLALKTATPFTEYHLVDQDSQALAALMVRAEREAPGRNVIFYSGDANLVVGTIADRIPPGSLSLAVIDPTGLTLKFESLRRLTAGRKVDLIYLFPEGMSIKRNLWKFIEQSKSLLDDALGTDRWRQRVKAIPDPEDPLQEWEAMGHPILELFQEQLTSLGYEKVTAGSFAVEVRATGNLSLYYLVFASKHPRGYDFWGKIGEVDPQGQLHFRY